MLPTTEEVLAAVRRQPGSSTRDLASRWNVDETGFPGFVRVLLDLQKGGQALKLPGGAGWTLPKNTPFRVGRLTVDRRGNSYVRVAPRSDHEEDLYLPPNRRADSCHGDWVLVSTKKAPRRGMLREAAVVEVVERTRRLIRGELHRKRQGAIVTPRHVDLTEIHIGERDVGDAGNGDTVLVRLLPGATAAGVPCGRVEVLLENEGSLETDLAVIRAEYELPGPFPEAVETAAESAELPDVESIEESARRDLRNLLTITIDPESACDFDDAISMELLPDGERRLGVHIADVSHYVEPQSALDREAARRGTSVYLPGAVIPMLPERLSNDLCSLRPNEDRFAKTVFMTFTPTGDVKSVEVCRSLIRSDRRFTYAEVLAILKFLETGHATMELPADHEKYVGLLRPAAELRRQLKERRHARGVLTLEMPVLALELGADGEVTGLGREESDEAHSLIEEFMLEANEAVARFFIEKELPLVARVHPAPDAEKLADFRDFLASLDLHMGGGDPARDFQRLVRQIKNDPLAAVIQLALLRTMGHAEYQLGAGLHFALATTSYCHFTSPIRRFPDLLVHQVLDDYFDGRLKGRRLREWRRRLDSQAVDASELEKRAEDAERSMIALRTIRYLTPMVGQEMDGRIASVHAFGFFVRVEEPLIDGLVHVSTLGDDYYEHDRRAASLVGQRRGRTYKVGQAVRVELSEVDPDAREISFRLAKPVPNDEADERRRPWSKSASPRRRRRS